MAAIIEDKEKLSYHNLKLNWNYHLTSIRDLKIEQGLNEHARLTLTGILAEEDVTTFLQKTGRDWLELYQVEKGETVRTLFKGMLANAKLKATGGFHYLELTCLSRTFDLDIKRRQRTFQNTALIYEELIRQILSAYPDGDFIDTASQESAVGNFMIQYEETDWQFLKRLASHLGTVLVADYTEHKPRLWFGMPKRRKEISLEPTQYTIHNNLRRYQQEKENNSQDPREPYHIPQCTITTYHYLNLGDSVNLANKNYTVVQSTAQIENSLLSFTYQLMHKEGIWQNRTHNQKIQGLALDGKVIDITRNAVKIHLDIDQEQPKEQAQWFPYAAEGNNVWYLMPELQSRVKLHFINTKEEDAIVINSVRQQPKTEEAAAREQTKMNDPGEKSLRTPYGKEIDLRENDISLSAKEGVLYISLDESEGVTIKSDNDIVFSAEQDITLEAKKIEIKAQQEIILACRESSIILTEEQLGINSPQTSIEGSEKKEYPSILSEFEQ